MGVSGLTSLIAENSDQLIKPHLLRDSKLVLDGCNIYHQLFYASKINYKFGGDYDQFATTCRAFFHGLRHANIDPIIILDGCIDPDDSKLATVMHRQKARLAMARGMIKGERGRILPLFAGDVFLGVARNLGVPILQCLGDADAIIAAAANFWSCPVLSLDSDFFIFNLTAGYIPFDKLDLNCILFAKSEAIACSIFRIDQFGECFPNLNKDLLALFATLSGNDFSNTDSFDKFLTNLPTSSQQKRRRLKITKKHETMIALLHWLENKTMQEAIEGIVERMKKQERDQLRQLITANVQNYVINFFDNIPSVENLDLDVTAFHQKLQTDLEILVQVPTWFSHAYVTGRISPPLVHALVRRRILLPTCLEDFKLPSVHGASAELRHCCYSILFTDSGSFEEFYRQDGRFAKHTIQTIKEMEIGLLPLPPLWAVGRVSRLEKEMVLANLSGTRVDELSQIEPQLRMFCLVLLYWTRSSQVESTPSAFAALALCVFMNVLENGLKSPETQCVLGHGLCVDLTDQIVAQSSKEFMSILRKFRFTPDLSKKGRGLRIDIIHTLSQWQAVYRGFSWLNQLLNFPEDSCIDLAFSGRFLYNIICSLEAYPNPIEAIISLLSLESSNSNPVVNKFVDFLRFLHLLVGNVESYFVHKKVHSAYTLPHALMKCQIQPKEIILDLSKEFVARDETETETETEIWPDEAEMDDLFGVDDNKFSLLIGHC